MDASIHLYHVCTGHKTSPLTLRLVLGLHDQARGLLVLPNDSRLASAPIGESEEEY